MGEVGDDGRGQGEARELCTLVRRFVGAQVFRSAAVDELLISDDFYRRPLRPEDWDFIQLKPVQLDSVSELCSLACNRILACIYDQRNVCGGVLSSAPAGAGLAGFCDPGLRALGQQLRPELERLVFSELEGPSSRAAQLVPDELALAFSERMERERALCAEIDAGALDLARRAQIRRFAWLQFYAMQCQRASAFEHSLAREGLPQSLRAAVGELRARIARDETLCRELGLSPQLHAHWQFYLPTTLLVANHTNALAGDSDRVFCLIGAFLFASLHAHAFMSAHGFADATDARGQSPLAAILTTYRVLREELLARHGTQALQQLAGGFLQAKTLMEISDRERLEQVIWLRDMERYRELALSIDRKIREEGLEIDRETFVEPREMCSTTHVHDDHRLVVIESGDMVFWAMPGMRLALGPGEMTLVPRGRLHGSTVESAQCVYHQPIIPHDWVATQLPEACMTATSRSFHSVTP